MTRALLLLSGCLAATTAVGCLTPADLNFLGMGDRPRDTVVEASRSPLMLSVEPPPGDAAPAPGRRTDVPRAFHLYRGPATGWNSPWRGPGRFGLAAGPEDARWSVRGAGREGLGFVEEPRQRLTFGDGAATPAPKATPTPGSDQADK